jgi:hypothetical protein
MGRIGRVEFASYVARYVANGFDLYH